MATYETSKEREAYTPEFDYSVWTPNTSITLTNVPWDSSYRDVVRFDSTQARDTWFQNRVGRVDSARLTGFVYLKYGEPVMVPLPFSQCNQMNYLIAENPIQPVPTRSSTPARKPDKFYYFIQDVQYVAPNTTALIVQLDVWTTYYDRISFGQCYITRGHIAMANENCTLDTMKNYLQDPEGLEYGDEYDTVYKKFVPLTDATFQVGGRIEFFTGTPQGQRVLIVANTDLTTSFGSETNPKLKTATGSFVSGVCSGSNVYVMRTSYLEDFYDYVSDYPWVSQGIVSMTVVPASMTLYPARLGWEPKEYWLGGTSASKVKLLQPPPRAINTAYYHNYRTYEGFNEDMPADMQNVLKLWQYPYCFIELNTFQGSPVILKPQYWIRGTDTENGKRYWNVAMRSALCPPNQKILMWPTRYNEGGLYDNQETTWQYKALNGQNATAHITTGDFIASAVEIADFPQLPVVNNMYQYYLASTNATRGWQYSNASWAYQKSITGANNALNLANASMQSQAESNRISTNLSTQQAQIGLEQSQWGSAKALGGSGLGMLGSAVSGDLSGVLGSGVNVATAAADAAMSVDWLTRSNANAVNAANAQTSNSLGYQRQVADTNKAYADYAAMGDYQRQVQGIAAQVRDARLTQPSVSGQLNGGSYAFQNGLMGLCVTYKRIKPEYLQSLYQYFKRYGYYVNRWIQPPANLKCMTKYTYWQMTETNIFGVIPEGFKQAIRGIFESGVTVWNNPDEVGRVAPANNQTVTGVRY